MTWDAKSGSARLPLGPGDGDVAVVLRPVALLDQMDEAALGEVVRAGPEKGERRPLGRVGEAPEAGAVEREVAAPVGETRAGLGLRHPGAELDLADAGTGNPDDRRFRHRCAFDCCFGTAQVALRVDVRRFPGELLWS